MALACLAPEQMCVWNTFVMDQEHPLQGARFSGGATARDDQNDAPEGARRPEHTEGRVRIVHTSETDVSLQAQWRM